MQHLLKQRKAKRWDDFCFNTLTHTQIAAAKLLQQEVKQLDTDSWRGCSSCRRMVSAHKEGGVEPAAGRSESDSPLGLSHTS